MTQVIHLKEVRTAETTSERLNPTGMYKLEILSYAAYLAGEEVAR